MKQLLVGLVLGMSLAVCHRAVAADDPQVAALEVFRPTQINDGIVQLVNHPNRYDGKVPELRVKGLKLGEHTREILAEYGFSPDRIEDLVARKIVFAAEEPRPEHVSAAAE